MTFRFAYPVLLFLFVATAGWLAFALWRRPAGITHSMTSGIAGLAGGSGRLWDKIPLALRAGGLILLVLASARPQLFNVSRENRSPGVDIMLCLDTSGSIIYDPYVSYLHIYY